MLLLDTCTFIWLASEPSRISAEAAGAIDEASDVYLSDVTVWEICLKWQSKKIILPALPRTWVEDQARAWQLRRRPIGREELYRTTELADIHRDPFDRLLVAQALVEGFRIVTPDPAIRQYPVTVVW